MHIFMYEPKANDTLRFLTEISGMVKSIFHHNFIFLSFDPKLCLDRALTHVYHVQVLLDGCRGEQQAVSLQAADWVHT